MNENQLTKRIRKSEKIRRAIEWANERGKMKEKIGLKKTLICLKKTTLKKKKQIHDFEKIFSDKIYVDCWKLHESKNKILGGSTGDFEMVGKMLIVEQEQKIIITYRNVEDYETYVNAIDVDSDSADGIFTGWVNKLTTP